MGSVAELGAELGAPLELGGPGLLGSGSTAVCAVDLGDTGGRESCVACRREDASREQERRDKPGGVGETAGLGTEHLGPLHPSVWPAERRVDEKHGSGSIILLCIVSGASQSPFHI